VQRHATLAAKRVSSDHPNLAARVWDDIERNASDPQYAAAFLAALGAAGLAVLGAAIAKRRKQGQDDREAARRQATLDELTRAARQYEATAETFPLPAAAGPGRQAGPAQPAGPRAGRQEPGPSDQEAGPGDQEAGPGDQEAGPGGLEADPAPRLRLVTTGAVDSQPDAQIPAAEGS
jgi:hypothetical protein